MSIDENRNCACSNNDNYNMMNNYSMMNNYNMMNDSNSMNNNNSCGCETGRTIDCCEKEEMLQQIRCYDFAINELALYLDTHPEDEKALCLHRKYAREAKDLKDKYQKVYGPLTINFPCNKWRWLEEPWPWERGNF